MTPEANTLYCIFLLFALASLHTWACRRAKRLERQRQNLPEPQESVRVPIGSIPHPQES